MAGPGCPKDCFKGVQDGVKVIHAQLLWEIWAPPHVIKCCTGQCFMMQNASGGVVHCMFIKQRPCGPLARPFFQKGPNTEKKATTTHQELQKGRQSTIYTQDPQLQGGSECMLSSSQCPNKLHQCFSLSPLFSDKLFSLSGRELQCFEPHCASHVHASVEEGRHTPAGGEPGIGNCQMLVCQAALGMRLI